MKRSDAERERLREHARRDKDWKRWGPYLAERQWGTVREDYSIEGDPWTYFPHEHARSRVYRWGEDGLLGITDRQCRLCFSVALWNERDPILKERLFGVGGKEGNHGEDVKEAYFYLDATPTHSYLKALYKYPQAAFPYERLVAESRRRSRHDPEPELADTGVFDGDRYFDVQAEYAKGSPNDVLVRLTVTNRGPEAARLHVLPTVWFRNTWAWGRSDHAYWPRGRLWLERPGLLRVEHVSLGRFRLASADRDVRWLFTENESNAARLWGAKNRARHVKDAFHDFVVDGRRRAVSPRPEGTKAAAHHVLTLAPGASAVLRLRLSDEREGPRDAFAGFDAAIAARIREADAFYEARLPRGLAPEERRVARQAYGGLLWSEQFYHLVVEDWLQGDPPLLPPPERRHGPNGDWGHLYAREVISMPDKWEYPWFAAWDVAFQAVALARVDPEFAKEQLLLLMREWYMHANGQLPAYEFGFGDVNPPVQAWACWRVYKMTGRRGARDRVFLTRAFHKLLFNFSWWVNRKDHDGNHLFQGGFLGLDNIGVFDRSRPPPVGGSLEQADGTAWMAFFCSTMLAIALELAAEDPSYEDIASKFFEHFVAIADAANNLGGTGLWDDGDGFYYDKLHHHGRPIPLAVRSMVGIIPLFAVEVVDEKVLARLPGFAGRTSWFLRYRADLARRMSILGPGERPGRRLLAFTGRERLQRVLRYLLDEREFLSPYGVRSLSRVHGERPFVLELDGYRERVEYVPGESNSGLFGGNSNWRGPVWLPLNFLLVEALERYGHFYGDSFRVECPTGSGRHVTLTEAAREIARRVVRLFLPDAAGRRPLHGGEARFADDPHWRELVLFYEHFHGETGRGLGASHQTGWTALVTHWIEDLARS